MWPFPSTQNQQYNKYSKNKHAEKSNMGQNSKSNEKHTWIALVAIALFPFPLFFTPKNPQNPPNLSVSSSMCLFPTILSCAPLLFFSFSPYIRISLSNSICSRESTFLSSISLPFSKIRMLFSFHAGLLFPYVCSHINSFFLIKYFSYLLECTYLSES